MAFGYGCENFSKYEEQGIGIQWHNIGTSPEEGERYTFIVSIIMMLFDAVFYWTLTWYIENVFPGIDFGADFSMTVFNGFLYVVLQGSYLLKEGKVLRLGVYFPCLTSLHLALLNQ